MDKNQLMKKHGITAKQVDLICMVAKHPIHGANQREFGRILPAALKYGVVTKVWLDRSPPILKYVRDTIPGSNMETQSNEWYELTERAVAFMSELDTTWKYNRPSDRWRTN